ncbi:amidohydrolase 2 [Fistulina hepatica ATCC 64428]|uniref:Amidohydrolase 2 n=1 Tax=Fistulina hepatica ATCC 64428 TaxID=1128425 RepID=A0A0D7AAE6_9AGAR|nr:amidohydrolase 2 [Fistulina hepatica ATCC 64428]
MKVAYPQLYEASFNHLAIDSHAHPILKAEYRSRLPPEGIVSEASGDALAIDSPHTLASMRATLQLSQLFGMPHDSSWEAVKRRRTEVDYKHLCNLSLAPVQLYSILVDDGLEGVAEFAEDYRWFNQFTQGHCRRVVRIEREAEVILTDVLSSDVGISGCTHLFTMFSLRLRRTLESLARLSDVVAFKTIVCYRSGLDVSPTDAVTPEQQTAFIRRAQAMLRSDGHIRIADKPVNDHIVHMAMDIGTLPVQFHTGLGDNDIRVVVSSPAHMQPLIVAYPSTQVVLLHAAYPFTREAAYLTSVYHNVYLDLGLVCPVISALGQLEVMRQALETAPTNKIIWSTDAHWWPETYYLSSRQSRGVLYQVLSECVNRKELSETQAVSIVQNILFYNANNLYRNL